jgi:hypothetical protein
MLLDSGLAVPNMVPKMLAPAGATNRRTEGDIDFLGSFAT